MQLIPAAEQIVQQSLFIVDVALQQGAGQLILVFEMVEKAAFGDAHRCNQFIN